MNSKNTIKNLGPLDIVVFHVGGIGNYGPIDTLIEKFPERVVAVCFEANPSEADIETQRRYQKYGVRTIFVPKCVADKSGLKDFYVNKHPESSSIFPPSPGAVFQHVKYKGINTWGENCELDHVKKVDAVTFDELVDDKYLPEPDVFSIDAQGAELLIMRGGQKALKNVLCVITEVEFFEIYKGQDMFYDHQIFLRQNGFRLAEILSTQYWHPGPAAGLGFAVQGEALFFRELEDLKLHKLIKLAILSYAYGRFSYSSQIISFAIKKYGTEARSLLLGDRRLKKILDMQEYMEKNNQKYLEDNLYFYKKERVFRAVRNFLRPVGRPIKKIIFKNKY